VVSRLAQQTVNKITPAKRAGDKRRHHVTVGRTHAHAVADVDKDIAMTERNECEFRKVRVCGEVLERVELWQS
jgi:hypothetical protein